MENSPAATAEDTPGSAPAGAAHPDAQWDTASTSPPTLEADDGPASASGAEADDDNAAATATARTAAGAPNSKPAAPVQKRRRVTRACDECRRKKIKCDGKNPCTHCTVYSYECTYDQPSNRRRNAAPQYVEALETRVRRADALLRLVLSYPIDLDDPDIDASLQRGALPPRRPDHQRPPPTATGGPANSSGSDDQLESMVKAVGNLDVDEQGKWDYHGHSSGLSFIRRMREQFGDVISAEGNATPFVKSRPMSHVFDSPKSNVDSPQDVVPGADLPPKEIARQLCDYAINDASSMLRILHQPTFYAQLDRIYDTPLEQYTNDQNTFLPLFYAVLSLGSLFTKDASGDTENRDYEDAIEEGFKYFKASRQLLDIADCRDLTSLQAILYMILFLQCSAKMPTCYSYIGVALRSAIRIGLHRSFDNNFHPIEAELRKRVFWVIRKLDIYMGAMLGLPITLCDEDIDQDYPSEVDDEFITEDGILPMPDGRVCAMEAFNSHTDLVKILAKIVRAIYPLKYAAGIGKQRSSDATYTISYSKIREIETDLRQWEERLSPKLKPGGDVPVLIMRIQQLLRMSYAHAQLLLYRPFLHYVSPTRRSKDGDKRTYACAAACVSVSRNIIHITAEMKKQSLLVGGYWYSMYTCFFAILSLVYYVLENPDSYNSNEIFRDANMGKETLASLSKRSMAADRCSATLKVYFKRLPERLTRSRPLEHAKKRRAAASPYPTPQSAPTPPEASPTAAAGDNALPRMPPRSTAFPSASAAAATGQPPFAVGPGISPSFPLEAKFASSPTTQTQQHAFDFSAGAGAGAGTGAGGTPPTSAPYPAGAATGAPAMAPFVQGRGLGPGQQGFELGDLNDPSLTDLSAFMFPSTDPFAYPNQPMMAFEDGFGGGGGGGGGGGSSGGGGGGGGGGSGPGSASGSASPFAATFSPQHMAGIDAGAVSMPGQGGAMFRSSPEGRQGVCGGALGAGSGGGGGGGGSDGGGGGGRSGNGGGGDVTAQPFNPMLNSMPMYLAQGCGGLQNHHQAAQRMAAGQHQQQGQQVGGCGAGAGGNAAFGHGGFAGGQGGPGHDAFEDLFAGEEWPPGVFSEGVGGGGMGGF
ncbi:fungal-specific transcription factor domain-containing protein [Lineolata rhizophorae]|uniref:Fungal-specific transcription factor domain-containing protein n=1 Tax=Lineolata rhizophorae TaxID=578093 RepID=A0A6A6NVU9_9PEZI|nr:fungal-specific transcription factor domain-containing protein [Lineolata rhizophorae]